MTNFTSKINESFGSDLVEYLDKQIDFLSSLESNKSVRKVTKFNKDLVKAIKNEDPVKSVEVADNFVKYIESLGGIVKGAKRIGPKGQDDVTLYSSVETQNNHLYVLRLQEVVIEAAS